MTFRDRFEAFASGYDPDLPAELEDLYRDIKKSGLPVIRRALFPLMRFIVNTSKPKKILEVGTGYGFSSLFIWHCLYENGVTIDTIEARKENALKATRHFRVFGADKDINLIEGDAGEIIGKLTPGYDLVFLDGPKAQYSVYFPAIADLISENGLLIADNILTDGDILKSRYALERRQRTIHARMHEFLDACFNDKRFETVILPVADGVSISFKTTSKTEKEESDETT